MRVEEGPKGRKSSTYKERGREALFNIPHTADGPQMKSKKVTPEEAQKNAEAVRRFWEDGQASLHRLQRLGADALKLGNKAATYAEEAKRLGTNIDRAAKQRRAAEEYTETQINALCESIERHRSRFGPSNLLVLLRVEDRRQRDAITRQAIRENWSYGKVVRAVQALRGERREHVGRRPRVPDDPVERLLALDAAAEKWCRWCDAALPQLPEALHPLVAKTATAVRQLQGAATTELERLRAGQGRRRGS